MLLVLVAALGSLFGRWNWWLPARAAKIPRAEPSQMPSRPAVTPLTREPTS